MILSNVIQKVQQLQWNYFYTAFEQKINCVRCVLCYRDLWMAVFTLCDNDTISWDW